MLEVFSMKCFVFSSGLFSLKVRRRFRFMRLFYFVHSIENVRIENANKIKMFKLFLQISRPPSSPRKNFRSDVSCESSLSAGTFSKIVCILQMVLVLKIFYRALEIVFNQNFRNQHLRGSILLNSQTVLSFTKSVRELFYTFCFSSPAR